MRVKLRRELSPQPVLAPAIPLTADHMAEAVIRAAMAMGEMSQLSYRYEAALKGLCTFRARWVALAALFALHPEIDEAVIARPLGCGPNPRVMLARCRGYAWWDEALVERLFVDLVESAEATPIEAFEALRRSVADLLADQGAPSLQTEGACA